MSVRQRLLSADGSEVDDEIIAEASKLVVLECWPPDSQEDKKRISAAKSNDVATPENLLKCPRNPLRPNLSHKGAIPLHYAAANGHVEPLQLLEAADLNADSGLDG